MNRIEAREFYPILQAFAEGRVIECRTKPSALGKGWQDMNNWTEMKDIVYWDNVEYRIKPEPTYRPFRDGAECWEIVQKEGFDWVKIKGDPMNTSVGIAEVNECNMFLSGSRSEEPLDYKQAFNVLTFLDGEPFGMKEE
jgi:hypothetical protein